MRTELGGDLFLFYIDYLYDFDLKKIIRLTWFHLIRIQVAFPDSQHLEMNPWELKALMAA